MSPTLLEWAIALFLVLIAWRIGVLLAPWVVSRFRRSSPRKASDRKDKPPTIIDT